MSGPTGASTRPVRILAMLAFLGCVSGRDALADTIRVPSDYSTIQDAVSSAVPGDVIVVGPGTYRELVIISKSGVQLRAEPEQGATIDGNGLVGPAISVVGTVEQHVTGVSIVGFRIENVTGPGINLSLADLCDIRSNNVNNTAGASIALARSTFNVITGNTLSSGTIGVSMSVRSGDNAVKENVIAGVAQGIRVAMVDTTPLRNLLKDNLICVTDATSVTGVTIAGTASGNTVAGNKIAGNGVSTVGIRLEGPTVGNVVKENILNDHAIDIEDLGTGNTVTGNVRHRSLKCPQR